MSTTARTLEGKHVLLIVGGGIAAFKSVTLARELLARGATVDTLMTDAGQRFVGAVTFAGITGRAPLTDLWDASFSGELHVELTDRADLIVVCPATADLMAKAAAGLANDLATAALLCAKSPVLWAPAMHTRMWDHPSTRSNIAALRARGDLMEGPVVGALANGAVGAGRMSEPTAIALAVERALSPRDLLGVRLLVSAGPTHEALDPVRFIGNRSSGKMGIAIADAAARRGAEVTLVHGPIAIRPAHSSVKLQPVRSAREMQDAITALRDVHDVIVMAAAVADYRPAEVATQKIKKSGETLSIELVKNPDILAGLGSWRGEAKRPVLVGFAVETTDLVGYARKKLERKRCDCIVANLASDGFEGDDNVVTIVSADGEDALGRAPKSTVAGALLDRIKALLKTV
ncbi:MAG: bifunctional phosphopantothenoylcysteine decarboxylase/phosphopantothenate--cysteine ligase CoaBC [Deltaproteobacteria bacterium]|nr:bifunctional phosphopantothenoylcysteine decarboxylase/phosphopantothenate--cysteine ligase CoaBC [Deltaproteobacteria bacterium]